MNYRSVKNKLEVSAGSQWELLYEFRDFIHQFLCVPEGIVANTMKETQTPEPYIQRNVFLIDFSGRQRWQIARARSLDDQYIGIELHDGKLIAHAQSGNSYEVNFNDGSVMWVGFGK